MTENEKIIEEANEIAKGRMYATNEVIRLQKELEQYRAIGTIDEFKALKEKNEPKKPIEETDNDGYIEYYCPNCEAHLFFDEEQKFCNECGQALET